MFKKLKIWSVRRHSAWWFRQAKLHAHNLDLGNGNSSKEDYIYSLYQHNSYCQLVQELKK